MVPGGESPGLRYSSSEPEQWVRYSGGRSETDVYRVWGPKA